MIEDWTELFFSFYSHFIFIIPATTETRAVMLQQNCFKNHFETI